MRSICAVRVLRFLSLLLVVSSAVGQDLDPYGRIDPVDASASVLRRAIGPGGSPAVLASLGESAPPQVERLLEEMLGHPDPAMRTAAAVSLANRDRADLRRLIARLGDDDARGAFVVAMLGDGRLDEATAIDWLDRDQAGEAPVAIAILTARAGRAPDLARLRSLGADASAAPMVRGIAAGVLESEQAGAVDAWRASLADLPSETAETAIFATANTLEKLGAVAGLRALAQLEAGRPADDAIRAGIVLSLLRLDPASGTSIWTDLAKAGDRSRAIPTAMLLVSAERPLPPSVAATLPDEDPLQQAVTRLLAAAPADRPTVAIEAVRAGHLPTIRWLLDLPDERLPTATIEAMIDTALDRRRTAMIEVLLAAGRRLALIDPKAAERRLQAAIDADDDVAREAMLRGLVAAASPAAAAVARPLISAPDRRTRSLALLAVACGDTLEPASRRRLGRAAAGGGDLPDDLRPLAAWQHLVLEDRLNDVLPGLLGG